MSSIMVFCFGESCSGNMQEIPDADSFGQARKKGKLFKLTGKGFFFAGSWKERFCVLDGTKFYYYGNEKSSGKERSSGVLNLDYYDVCQEFKTKDPKTPYVFIVGTSVRGFFDNRHQFATQSYQEMDDWIRTVHDVIIEARTLRSRRSRNSCTSDKMSPNSQTKIVVVNQMNEDSVGEEEEILDDLQVQLVNATKGRVKGPQGRRLPQRKSMMPVASLNVSGLPKQRSFSLSSPNETQEEDGKEMQNLRIDDRRTSMSADAVNTNEDDSNDSILRSDPCPRSETKKPIFGRLGGQHSALTKELEFKLKSGLTPGGRRFQNNHSEENGDPADGGSHPDTDELSRKVDVVQLKVCSLKNEMDRLRTQVTDAKGTSEGRVRQLHTEIQDLVEEAKESLKEIRAKNLECDEALREAKEAKSDYQILLKECRQILNQLKNSESTDET